MWQTNGEKECVLTRGGLTDITEAIECWRLWLKQDLSIVANAALRKVVSVFTGSIGMEVTALWMISDVTVRLIG